jgi:hypothetical protein
VSYSTSTLSSTTTDLHLLCRGLGTVYIQRTTEDVGEDMASIRDDVDLFLDGTRGDTSCGLMELADMLCL